MPKPRKPRKCRNKQCDGTFMPRNSLHTCCSPMCGIMVHRERQEKRERKALRERKKQLKTKSQWLKEAQSAFNKFIRLRDISEPCISCGRHHTGQYHAGHYRSIGAAPELRFHEDNCSKQCAPCNNHKSGNAIEYRINLIKKIGLERVEWLEGPHEPKKYTIDEIKAIKARYTALCRELKQQEAA